jgi:ferredoxin
MKAKVEPELCIGCELCVQTCPEVFVMESDKAVVKVDTVPGEAAERCRQAKEECPVEAINIEE